MHHIFYNSVRELSEAEKKMIVHSEDFQQFMDRAGRVMERALSENVDIYTDYTGALNENDVKLVSTKLYKIIRYLSVILITLYLLKLLFYNIFQDYITISFMGVLSIYIFFHRLYITVIINYIYYIPCVLYIYIYLKFLAHLNYLFCLIKDI